MMKIIQLNNSLYDICQKHPEVISIMSELGFTHINKPGLLQTAGKVMTIEKGCKMRGIPFDMVTKTFEQHGFTLMED